jgi:mercuric ion transport protein
MSNRMIIGGVVGGGVAPCCFTPAPAALLGALGLSAWLGGADYVLMPAFAFFVPFSAYAIRRRTGKAVAACDTARAPASM